MINFILDFHLRAAFMPKEEAIEVEGTVIEPLPNASFELN
jgi:hypothetical protein